MITKSIGLVLIIAATISFGQNESKDSIGQKSPTHEQEIKILLKALNNEIVYTSKINLLNSIARLYPLDQSNKIKLYADSAFAMALKINWKKVGRNR